MSEVVNSIIYVDIEALLDLRMGYLHTQVEDTEKLTEYLFSIEYNYRETDKFPILPDGNYSEAMKNPSPDILTNSLVTYILGVVIQKLNSIEKMDKIDDVLSKPVLWVNVYPFKLSEEVADTMRNYLFHKTGEKFHVEIVYTPIEEVTPMYLKEINTKTAIFYSFNKWVEAHGKRLENKPIEDIELIFAPILEQELTKEDKEVFTTSGFKDVFSYTEFAMSPVSRTQFLPTVFFSNIIIAEKHLSEQFDRTKKEMEERSSQMEIPEEFKQQLKDLGM